MKSSLLFFPFSFAPLYRVVVSTRNNFESETQEEDWARFLFHSKRSESAVSRQRQRLHPDLNAYATREPRHPWSFLFDADLVSWKLSFRATPRNHRPPPPKSRPLSLIEIKSCHETIRGRKQPSSSLPTLIIAIDKDSLLYDSFLESSGEKAADRASPPGLLPR